MVLKLRGEVKGSHVHVQVFMGPLDGNLGHCGNLVMKASEYLRLSAVLREGRKGFDFEPIFEVSQTTVEEIE